MNAFINHSLTLLEDIGISYRHPEIRPVTLANDGSRTVHMNFHSKLGIRVSIEQNQPMKFMMMFTLLDFYIDSTYLGMEGNSFSQKYRRLPSGNDYDVMLRELFRIAKVIRNSLVHNPSSLNFSDQALSVKYNFKGSSYSINMSAEALSYFYTAIVMYIKGNLGRGNYFLGVMRRIYDRIVNGIENFSDEFSQSINIPSAGLRLSTGVRYVILNPDYIVEHSCLRIITTIKDTPKEQGTDLYIDYRNTKFLVPVEALSTDLTINKGELENYWKYENIFSEIIEA